MKQSANYQITGYQFDKGTQEFSYLEINGESVPLASSVEAVATPVITQSTAISIASETASALIFYQEDDGAFQQYTIPFTPTVGTKAISAFAVKDGMLPSATAVKSLE